MSAIAGVNTASTIGQDYMTLLITQLQNQNPLEPMSNSDMTSQLAQISSLEHMESLDTSFTKVLLAARLDDALSMMGKNITFINPDSGKAVQEAVKTVGVIDGDIMLSTENYTLGLDAVQVVSN